MAAFSLVRPTNLLIADNSPISLARNNVLAPRLIQTLESSNPPDINHSHDLIVIGAGSAGLGAAGFGGLIGLKVALIDKTAKAYGGDCLNYGCVPSKALLHVAAQFAGARRATDFGLEVSGKADFGKVMAYIREAQSIIREHETPEFLREEYGLETVIGTAKLSGRREVSVNGRTLSAPRIVLATGSKPRHLEVKGHELVKQWDNESIFGELEELPEKLFIVGGGPISCELAQAFTRLGSEVVLISRDARLLGKDPLPAVRPLEKKLRAEGVDIRYETEVAEFLSPTRARLKGKHAGEIDFSHCLAAIGRSVRTEGLGLDVAGVATRDGKIVADAYYRTSNRNVFAIGDAYGREMFSHGAEKHNTDLWTNLLSPIDRKHKLDHFSWVTFTDPEVATFGLTEEQLKERGTDYTTIDQPLDHDDRAVAADYRDGYLRLYLDGKKLLGGTLTAPAAGEIIQELQLLQQLGLNYGKLTNKVYAYPVASRINQKPARDRTQERYFSDTVKWALRKAYRLQNR